MHGQLTARSPTEVCRELAEAGATGVLFLTGVQASGSISFERGRLVAASSPTPGSRLGDRLVNGGLLEEDALDRVLEEQHETDRSQRARLGQLLVDRGLVSAGDVRRVIEEQLLDAVFDLAGWREGSYRFESDAALETPDVALAIPVDQALVEVARRRHEWESVSEVITDLDAIPHFREGAASATAELEPDEFAVLASVDGDRSVRDLAYDLGYGEFEAARIVYALHLVGLVEMAPPVDEIGAALDDALSYVGGGIDDENAPWRSREESDRSAPGDAPGSTAAAPAPAGPEDVAEPSPRTADESFDSSIFDEVWGGGDGAGEEAGDATSEATPEGPAPEPWTTGPLDAPSDGPVPAPGPAEEATDPPPDGSDSGPPPADGPDTTLEADLPAFSGFEELRFADRHRPDEPEAAPAPEEPQQEVQRQRSPRSPSPGAGGDVSEFLRELSRLALDEDDPSAHEDEQPAAREPEPRRPAPAEHREETRKKKRGLFGFGS